MKKTCSMHQDSTCVQTEVDENQAGGSYLGAFIVVLFAIRTTEMIEKYTHVILVHFLDHFPHASVMVWFVYFQ